ncbi:MAG: reverse transcriptase family protein [Tepidisphaeraceae bacterium]
MSAGLADRTSDFDKLRAAGLPELSTPADLAAAFGLPIPRLRFLAYHAEASTVSHYVQFMVPKKSGGERLLSAPHKHLATAQQWVLDAILRKLPVHDAAHGFVNGRSILTNAKPHVGRAVVVNCDLTDFFPSITVHRVIGFFRHLGYSPAVATVLALLVTECPRRKARFAGKTWHIAVGPRGLPQGACTSPALSNLIARRLDSRLSGITRKLGWTYTRYADDLTFSCNTATPSVGYLLARVRHITGDEGFAINEKKTRVLKRSARQAVTGIVVNVEPSVPRKTRRRLRAILHHAKHEGLATQQRPGRANITGWANGMTGFIAMVNPRHALPLRMALDAVKSDDRSDGHVP